MFVFGSNIFPFVPNYVTGALAHDVVDISTIVIATGARVIDCRRGLVADDLGGAMRRS